MTPRITSFKSIWDKVMLQKDTESASSPAGYATKKRSPLVPYSSNMPQIDKSVDKNLKLSFNRILSRPRCTVQQDIRSLDGLGLKIDKSACGTGAVIIPSEVETSNGKESDFEDTKCSKELFFGDISNSRASCPEKEECAQIFSDEYVQCKPDEEYRRIEDNEIFRALVTTDTHLGFKEGDLCRSNDSISPFEEVLYLAKNLKVDCILHSGDLFDDTHPSRSVMYRTMELIGLYCTKDDTDVENSLKVQIPRNEKYLSERSKRIESLGFNCASTDEKDSRLPFFVIHGNHDTPTGPKGLSPIDILDVANLVTYFGRVTDMDSIILEPILLRKASVNVALYGIGWIKDERLSLAFRENRVEFIPLDSPDEWYKIFLIHQNRYPRRGKGVVDYISESMLPNWLDLVIWGHEHECVKVPQRSLANNFRVLQLGSSIQTSLVPAEVSPKHCCLIEITTSLVKFYPILLETSRSFYYKELSLSTLEIKQKDDEKEIWVHLENLVNKILKNSEKPKGTTLCSSEVYKTVSRCSNIDTFKLYEAIKDAVSKPLIRLRINHGEYQTINPRAFGSLFTGTVANPYEMIRFWKKNDSKDLSNSFNGAITEKGTLECAKKNNKDFKDIVFSGILRDCRLKLLLEADLNWAVQCFATGMESQAISNYVRKVVDEVQLYLKGEISKGSNEHLSDDLYQELIENMVINRTESIRASTKKSYNSEDIINLGTKVNESMLDSHSKAKRIPDKKKCEDFLSPPIKESLAKRKRSNSIISGKIPVSSNRSESLQKLNEETENFELYGERLDSFKHSADFTRGNSCSRPPESNRTLISMFLKKKHPRRQQ